MQEYTQPNSRNVVLSIAGSDSSGGAGLQADCKTFSALGVYGTTAVTCLTAQTPEKIITICPVEAAIVKKQIEAIGAHFPIKAAKTGLLYTTDIIRLVAAEDVREGIPVLVVDPVIVSSTGAYLLPPDAIKVLCEELVPQARVITPNVHEAAILCNCPVKSKEDMRAAAKDIGNRFDVACVIKGGHLPGDEVVDVLYDEGEELVLSAPRVPGGKFCGTGCAFSAALTAFLAHGKMLREAVGLAKEYVHKTLEQSFTVGKHRQLNFECGFRIC